jgi:hypothetical protein
LRRRHWFRPGLLDVGAFVSWICPVTNWPWLYSFEKIGGY